VAVENLPASHIYPHADAREVNPAKVDALVDSIREVGLLSPIIVRRAMKMRNGVKAEAWEILAGHHRYEACVKLKWDDVPCIVMDTSDLHAELITIDENLCRANLSPAEEAYQTARRKEIYEALHPETRHGVAGAAARWDAADKLSFASSTAKATGKDVRTVERNAARGEALGEDLKRVAGTSLDKRVELDALAHLSPEEREEIVARAQRGEKVSARQIKPAKLADEPLNDFEAREKQVEALMRAWNNAGAEAREDFLSRIDKPVMDRRYA